jgi:hypothetical protein
MADTLEAVAVSIAEDLERAVAHYEARHSGGQQVGYRGPFFGPVNPSGIKTLREWARMLRAALKEP